MEGYREVEILSNEQLTQDMFLMKVALEDQPKPGQFYMLRAWEGVPYLPRPFSVCDADGKSLSFLYQKVGKGTRLMTSFKPGDHVHVLGPLGNGYPLLEGSAALVGGGVGIAPLLYLARKLEGPVDVFIGFREEAFFLEEFKPFVRKIYVSTENGSLGHKGYVTELLTNEYTTTYACGNMLMMKAVKNRVSSPLYLSLEAHMACGIGACLGCSQKTKEGQKCICKEGPVFSSEEVLLD